VCVCVIDTGISFGLLFQILKQYAEDIALALTCNKQRYQLALDKLESISDEVHEQRRLVLPPRTPGVGAEAGDDLSNWPSVNIGEYFVCDICHTSSCSVIMSPEEINVQFISYCNYHVFQYCGCSGFLSNISVNS